MIKKEMLDALFVEIHKAIKDSAQSVSELDTNGLSYPPGIELSTDEIEAIQSLQLSDSAKSGLSKLVSDACAVPLFHLFCLLDGVSEPQNDSIDTWCGLALEEKKEENYSMLHDEFYETYWNSFKE